MFTHLNQEADKQRFEGTKKTVLNMPKRLPMRAATIVGNIFVVLVSWVIGVIYYAYVFLVWLPKAEDN